ncbi:MAG: S8 family serine peptidase [Planctomycetes bacterium]|nr:S8 family serine peptidase [Planctomycetota bacterium]
MKTKAWRFSGVRRGWWLACMAGLAALLAIVSHLVPGRVERDLSDTPAREAGKPAHRRELVIAHPNALPQPGALPAPQDPQPVRPPSRPADPLLPISGTPAIDLPPEAAPDPGTADSPLVAYERALPYDLDRDAGPLPPPVCGLPAAPDKADDGANGAARVAAGALPFGAHPSGGGLYVRWARDAAPDAPHRLAHTLRDRGLAATASTVGDDTAYLLDSPADPRVLEGVARKIATLVDVESAGPIYAADDGSTLLPRPFLLIAAAPGYDLLGDVGFLREHGLRVEYEVGLGRFYVLRSDRKTAADLVTLSSHLTESYADRIVSATPSLLFDLKTSAVVNDPIYPKQYDHLNFTRVLNAWSAGYSWKREVRIAVIDSAFDVDHPDLRGGFAAGFDAAEGDADVSGVAAGYSIRPGKDLKDGETATLTYLAGAGFGNSTIVRRARLSLTVEGSLPSVSLEHVVTGQSITFSLSPTSRLTGELFGDKTVYTSDWTGAFHGAPAIGAWRLNLVESPIDKQASSVTTWSLEVEYDAPHGTMVSGVAVAQANNGVGLAGVAGNGAPVKVVPIKVLTRRGFTSTDILIAGIARGVQLGLAPTQGSGGVPACVLSMSWGAAGPWPGGSSDPMRAALRAARDAGAVLVAATGNDDVAAVHYPAAYSEVIAVGACEPTLDKRARIANWWGSNYGPQVALVAPGSEIWTTTARGSAPPGAHGDGYASVSGTSIATPYVAAVAALMLAGNDRLRPEDVRRHLCSTATRAAAGLARTDEVGDGAVRADAAIDAALPHTVSAPTGALVPAEGVTPLVVRLTIASPALCSRRHLPVYDVRWGDGTTWEGMSASSSHTYAQAGTYPVTARARCAVGEAAASEWSALGYVKASASQHVVSRPTVSGPATGRVGVASSYQANAACSLGHALNWYFWYEGREVQGSGAGIAASWTQAGQQGVWARAVCSGGLSSEWSIPFWVTVVDHRVATPAPVQVPAGLLVGDTGTFRCATVACSVAGHGTEYAFEYADGSGSNWKTTPYAQSAFTREGSSSARARARCAVDPTVMSGWTERVGFTVAARAAHTLSMASLSFDASVATYQWAWVNLPAATCSQGHGVTYQVTSTARIWWYPPWPSVYSTTSPEYAVANFYIWPAARGTYTLTLRARCTGGQTVTRGPMRITAR